MATTVINKVTAAVICRAVIFIRITTKKRITPMLISQKAAFSNIKNALPDCSFMKENMREKVISETGKENPRKNIFSCSLGLETSFKYSLLSITRADISSPRDKHNRAAWWNFSEAGTLGRKKSKGKIENFWMRVKSTRTNKINDMAIAAAYK